MRVIIDHCPGGRCNVYIIPKSRD